MRHRHAVIWLDHLRSRVIGFSLDRVDTIHVESQRERKQIHRKAGEIANGHIGDDTAFFDDILASVADVDSLYVVGPGTAKTAFANYCKRERPQMFSRITGVNPADHPTDGELLAIGRQWFHRVDQLQAEPGQS